MGRPSKATGLVDRLCSFACFEYAQQTRQWKPVDIVRELRLPPDTKNHFKWITHQKALGDFYLERMLTAEPSAQAVANLPLWRLLHDEAIPDSEINELMARFRERLPISAEIVPPQNYKVTLDDPHPLILNHLESGAEVTRTDLFAFIETLALLRKTENQKAWAVCESLLGQLFAVLPVVGHLFWLKKEFETFFRALFALYMRIPRRFQNYHPDPRIVFGQFGQSSFSRSESSLSVSEDPVPHKISYPLARTLFHSPMWDLSHLARRYRLSSLGDLLGSVRANLGDINLRDRWVERFLLVIERMKLPRYCWEPVVGLTSVELAHWLGGETGISDDTRTRIEVLCELASRPEAAKDFGTYPVS